MTPCSACKAHVIRQPVVGEARGRPLARARSEDPSLASDAIAELYLYLHLRRRPRSAWSQKVDVRPWSERF